MFYLGGRYIKKKKKIKNEFPVGFWNVSRPNISIDEVLKDVTPISYNSKEKGKIVIYSSKEKNK